MILVWLIGLVSACAAFRGIYLTQTIYFELRDKVPQEFQNEEFAYAIWPQFALSPSTPLPLQADYVRSGFYLCAACFGFLVCAILVGSTIGTIFFLALCLGLAISSTRFAKTYGANRARRMTGSDEEGS